MINKLTNIDIVARLLEIREIKNVCDRAEALKAFEKEYKHSSFYRRTHKNLTLLYYEVALENILTLRTLLTNAQEFLNNLDLDHFNELMDQLNEQSRQNIEESLNAFSESGLLDLIKGHKA